LGGTGLVEAELLAVDGGDGSLPAGQGLLEFQIDVDYDVVSVSGVERVLLLFTSISFAFHRQEGSMWLTSSTMKTMSCWPPSS